MKPWVAITALSILSALLVGCTGGSTAAKEGTEPTSKQGASTAEFKVALITPDPVNDSGWNAMAYQGLKAIEAELGAKVVQSEAQGPKIRDAMRTYAQEGYSLIFGHGFEYNEPGVEIAAQFPNSVFLSSSGGKTAKNAGAFRFYLEEGFYLAGYSAAKMSKSGKLAMVGYSSIPSIASTFKAFEAGAKAANPNIVVKTMPLDLGADLVAAEQATTAALNEGADGVIHQANKLAQAVFDACAKKGAVAFGANANQNSNPSNVVVGSAVIVAKPAFLALAKEVKDGTFTGAVRTFSMKDGAIDFEWNPELSEKVSPDLAKELLALKEKIKSGELKVPADQF
jgi:basic membrane lipoprotein Med (substrate-binding protein (PBP1-ABC) superfamily)